MKSLRICLINFLAGVIIISFKEKSDNTLFSKTPEPASIWVSLNGSDRNVGSKEQPLASVHMALRKARELRRLHDPSINNGISIKVAGGVYQFEEPLFVRPEDSGTETSPTTIEAIPGERPVFSGGVSIKGWLKVNNNIPGLPKESKGQVWAADAPMVGGRLLEFRQLWVNGQKAVRARERDADSMNRILSWNHADESCWIPKPATGDLSHAEGLEMFIHQWWAIAILRVKSVEMVGDSARLRFYQPESRIESEHPWPAPWISKETGNSAFYLVNAIQFLNKPGEWFLDMKSRKVYYWPRKDEKMETASVLAPSLETLVKIVGDIDRPVSNFSFNGISFQHTGFMRPSKQGHVPHQAGLYMLDAYKLKIAGTPDKKTLENQAWVGRPSAAIEASFADRTAFENCRFEHLASTGIDYNAGVHDNKIKGNLFRDIGGTAVYAGVYSNESTEIHVPYNPSDEREVCSNMEISNNLINNVTNEDWGCVGIGAGYVKNINIEHNEICDVSYMGISLGWGWSRTINAMRNNKVTGNKIHHYAKQMYDVAGIYTLSAQPGTVISGNYIDSIYKAPYAHLPNHWFYLYTDEGTSYTTIRDNWTPSEKYLQNANGPGNTWQNNGPAVKDSIKLAAGLLPAYRHLLEDKIIANKDWPITHEQPVVMELVSGDNQPLDLQKLKIVLANYNEHPTSVYQWQNHYVIFDKVQDVSVLQGKIRNAFPDVQLKVYYDLFYEFNRQQRCNNAVIAKEWDNIILTANLVQDPKMQKEYFDYHATQFQKWPEVASGFCNANFQQLLVYRNGRQLVLVISIPKGESLDKLNPKTSENNPRVDEWNTIMKKYQEGIPGTKPGEVWVFFNEVKS